MNELYKKSTPSITWAQVNKKYGGTKTRFYEKHLIEIKKSEQILDKYHKKCKNKSEHDSLSMLYLDFAPKYKKENKAKAF